MLQTPWVENTTLRRAVLFGSEWDEPRQRPLPCSPCAPLGTHSLQLPPEYSQLSCRSSAGGEARRVPQRVTAQGSRLTDPNLPPPDRTAAA